ncbi:MAG TPA: hypothetical protein VLH86_04700 [Patescibacteria group bacterium]|nr:hypothetical protein [Patescibacteria group bacterium]
MILHIDGGRWYIDVRTADTSDQISFDLTQHVPRRLAAGKTLIIADNTKVFLSVIRKRWMKLLYEVECQRSSTLDKLKREALQYEVDQMRNCRFASKTPTQIPDANVYCLAPAELPSSFPPYMTLYITVPLLAPQVTQATESLSAGGLVVLYGPWLAAYEQLLKQAYTAGPNER